MLKGIFRTRGILGACAIAAISGCIAATAAFAQSAEELQEAFVRVAETVGPAVVNISTVHTERVGIRTPYFGSRDPYDEFLNEFLREFFGEMPEKELQRLGLGSGVIINPDGYILTNEHVIEGADEITVILSDGRKLTGIVTGMDPRSDLAVLKIDAKNLPFAKLGDSDEVRIGQWAIAIGNPFGHLVNNPEPTVTVGVVSATGRALPRSARRDRDYTDLIQTDAAINPGNSGGPLVNLKGEIIGINVAIFSTTGGYQGIGFAVPANSARRILSQLVEGKKIAYGWLGMNIQDVDEDLQRYFALPERKGVLVANVVPGGPAETAGIKVGDVITALNQEPLQDAQDLKKRIDRSDVGDKMTVDLLRDQKKLSVQMTIGERPGEAVAPAVVKQESWRGLKVHEMDPELKKRLGAEVNQGVVVRDVETGSPAHRAGLRAGDVIYQINRFPIQDLASYQKAIGAVQGDCLIRTHRGFAVLREK
ncbi:MAG: Do family serine endopeptidase [Candidatus Omnitrophota bacterium]